MKESGYSLIEACVALCIAATAAASAAPTFANLLDSRRMQGVSSELANDLQSARMAAVVRNQSVRFTLHQAADGACYVIHTGSAEDCRCNGDEPAVCSGGAKHIKSVWVPTSERVVLQANVPSLVFDPVMGTSTPTGTFRVVGPSSETRHVVNLMGRVRSCVAQGALSGYRAC